VTIGRLLESLTVCALKRNGLEENHHDKVETPNLVRLSQTVDAPHLALLVGVTEHTDWRSFACDAEDKVLAVFLCNILAQFGQEPRCPFLFHLRFLVLSKCNHSHYFDVFCKIKFYKMYTYVRIHYIHHFKVEHNQIIIMFYKNNDVSMSCFSLHPIHTVQHAMLI